MTARTKHDRHALSGQVIVGPKHVVVALDLVVDVMDAWSASWRQRDRVMDCIHPHEGNVSDPVADARIANLSPELLISRGISCAEPDMAESGDAGIPGGKIAPATAFRPNDKLDLVAGGILESNKCLDLARRALGRSAGVHVVAKRVQRRRRSIQFALVLNVKSNGLVHRVALKVADRVRPIV